MKRLGSIVAFLAVLLVAAHSAGAAAAAQSKQRAERNLLGATRMLKRWHVGFVDPKSGLLRQNTTAACAGKGKHAANGYPRFVCVLRHEQTVLRVLYVAQNHNGFEVHRLQRS